MSTVVSDVAATETAADHVATDVPVFEPGVSVGEVRSSLMGRRFASARDVAVCVDDTLVGLVTIETLLGADEHLLLEKVMEPDPLAWARVPIRRWQRGR